MVSVFCYLNQSQHERKPIQISGEMYNRNCSLTPMMLALSVVSAQPEQYKLNFKHVVSKISFTN